jgi:hypothetical protein
MIAGDTDSNKQFFVLMLGIRVRTDTLLAAEKFKSCLYAF